MIETNESFRVLYDKTLFGERERVELVTNLTRADEGIIPGLKEREGRAESCRNIIDFDIRRLEYITLVNIAVRNEFAFRIIQT